MFIAHLPAGYLSAKYLYRRFAASGVSSGWFMLASSAGALAPDLDLFYFFLIDHRRTPHHLYWSHFPLVWVTLLGAAFGWLYFARRKAPAILAMIFCAGGVGHLLLDSVVGDIYWRAPFSDEPFSLFTVPALYHPWWLSFILHWSFAFELALLAWAVVLMRRKTDRQ